VAFGLPRRLAANWSSTGAKSGWMSALPTANEMSLGMSSLSRLSAVCVTATPVPRVAASMSRFWRSMFCDQM
jgi:hypothetical protein